MCPPDNVPLVAATDLSDLFGFRFARRVGYDSHRDSIVAAGDEGGIDEARKQARKVKSDKKIDLAWVNLMGRFSLLGHPDDPGVAAALAKLDGQVSAKR